MEFVINLLKQLRAPNIRTIIVLAAFLNPLRALAMTTPNDTLTIYFDHVPKELNGLRTDSFPQWTVVYNLADRLVEFGDKGTLLPNLATTYRVSPDGREYVFEIDKQRKFHDGTPVTINDIIATFREAIENPRSVAKLNELLDCNRLEKNCPSIVTISENRIKVVLKAPSFNFIERLNMNEVAIRKAGTGKQPIPITSGPYKIKTANEDLIELIANEEHPQIGKGSFRKIVIKKLPASQNEIPKILRSQTTVLVSKSFPSQIDSSSGIDGNNAFFYASGTSYILSLKGSALEHQGQIKYAFHKCLTESNILKKFIYLKHYDSFFPEGFAAHAPFVPPKPIKSSKVKLTVKVQDKYINPEVLSRLRSCLVAYNIDASFEFVDESTFNDENSPHNALIAAPYIDHQHPLKLASSYFSGQWNYYKETNLNHLLERALNEPPEKQIKTLRQFFTELIKSGPIIPLFYAPNVILLSDNLRRDCLEYYGNTIKFALFRLKVHNDCR